MLGGPPMEQRMADVLNQPNVGATILTGPTIGQRSAGTMVDDHQSNLVPATQKADALNQPDVGAPRSTTLTGPTIGQRSTLMADALNQPDDGAARSTSYTDPTLEQRSTGELLHPVNSATAPYQPNP